MNDGRAAGCVFSIFVIVLILAILGVVKLSSDSWKGEAIKRGYAQMVIVDPVSGRTEFFWNDEITTKTKDTNHEIQ